MADYLILESEPYEALQNLEGQMIAQSLGSLAWKLTNVEKLPQNLIIYQNFGQFNENIISMINRQFGIELAIDDFRFFPAGVKKLADAICEKRNIGPLNIACFDSDRYAYPFGNLESTLREFETYKECEKNGIFYVDMFDEDKIGKYYCSLEGINNELKNAMQKFAERNKTNVPGGDGGNKGPVRQDKNDGDER